LYNKGADIPMQFKSIIVLLSVLILASCATITRKGTETIKFITAPNAAEVLIIDGEFKGSSCLTPCELEVDRRDELTVEITKPGYKTVTEVLRASLDVGSFSYNTLGNWILLPGVADYIDVRSGANYSHKPNPFVGVMIANQSTDSYDIPSGFIAAMRDWWGKDEEKTAWVEQRHQNLVFSEGLSPAAKPNSRYWTKMLDSIDEFDSMRKKQPSDEAMPDTSVASKLKFRKPEINQYDLAVIIGNRDYDHKDIPSVKSAHNDVVAFRKYAEQGLGIQNIIEVRDASASTMSNLFGNESDPFARVFNRMSSQAKKGRLFVFYSGHGVVSLRGNKALLVPSDADPLLYSQSGYPLERLYDRVSNIPATERHLIVDSCFSGSSEAGPLITRASPVTISLSEGEIPLNINVATATSSGEIASWDKGNGNSLFTKFYLLGQSGAADFDANGKVSPKELEEYVKSKVRNEAQRIHDRRQNPTFRYSVPTK